MDTSEKDHVETQTKPKFIALQIYSQLTSAIGWLQVMVGIIVIFIAYNTEDFTIAGIGFVVSLLGFPLIAFGQFLTTQIEIEKNTRETNELLRYLIEKFE